MNFEIYKIVHLLSIPTLTDRLFCYQKFRWVCIFNQVKSIYIFYNSLILQ